MSYSAYITKIKNVRKHSNADRLNIGECFGSQVIIDLNTKEDDLGVYFPSDGQLGLEYCEVNNLVRKKDENGKNIGGYLDPDKRNIRALKLRKEISDGLFMPLSSLEKFTDISKLSEGDKIDILGGVEICKKYVPKKNNTQNHNKKNKPKKIKTITYPNFEEHIDTNQLMYNLKDFKKDDICYITLKMHGTSGRTSYTIKNEKKYYNPISKFFRKVFKKRVSNNRKSYEYISGTRRVVLDDYSGGYYGSNEFRLKHHNKFIDKLHKGETVYYEIVGYHSEDSPIMGRVDNKKTQDKDFIKKYGKTTTYSYGCEDGKSDIYIYRMTFTNEDGYTVDYPWDMVKTRAEQMGMKFTPELDRFIYKDTDDLLERVKKHCDGVDPIGRNHIREGVVVRIEGKERFKAYKHKNFFFKVLEGIIKDAGVLDIEEQESIKNNDN